MTTTKVINGAKMVEVPFTVNFNVCIEEHKFLEYMTMQIPIEAMAEAGKATLLDSIQPTLDKGNDGWHSMMIEVVK